MLLPRHPHAILLLPRTAALPCARSVCSSLRLGRGSVGAGVPNPCARLVGPMRVEAFSVFEPSGLDKANQLALKPGDVVVVLEQDSSGWWGGYKEGDLATGWFPAVAVRPLHGDASAPLASERQGRGVSPQRSRSSREASPRQPAASTSAGAGAARAASGRDSPAVPLSGRLGYSTPQPSVPKLKALSASEPGLGAAWRGGSPTVCRGSGAVLRDARKVATPVSLRESLRTGSPRRGNSPIRGSSPPAPRSSPRAFAAVLPPRADTRRPAAATARPSAREPLKAPSPAASRTGSRPGSASAALRDSRRVASPRVASPRAASPCTTRGGRKPAVPVTTAPSTKECGAPMPAEPLPALEVEQQTRRLGHLEEECTQLSRRQHRLERSLQHLQAERGVEAEQQRHQQEHVMQLELLGERQRWLERELRHLRETREALAPEARGQQAPGRPPDQELKHLKDEVGRLREELGGRVAALETRRAYAATPEMPSPIDAQPEADSTDNDPAATRVRALVAAFEHRCSGGGGGGGSPRCPSPLSGRGGRVGGGGNAVPPLALCVDPTS